MTGAEGADDASAPLPPRAPRPFAMHCAVDAAVAFLATVFLLWFVFGVAIEIVLGLSLALGLAAAPFTRRAEAHQLAARAGREDQPR